MEYKEQRPTSVNQLRIKDKLRQQIEEKQSGGVLAGEQFDPEASAHGMETIEISGYTTTFAQAAADALKRLDERFKKKK